MISAPFVKWQGTEEASGIRTGTLSVIRYFMLCMCYRLCVFLTILYLVADIAPEVLICATRLCFCVLWCSGQTFKQKLLRAVQFHVEPPQEGCRVNGIPVGGSVFNRFLNVSHCVVRSHCCCCPTPLCSTCLIPVHLPSSVAHYT